MAAAAAPVVKPEIDYVSPTETWTENTEAPAAASHGNWADEVAAPAQAAPAAFTAEDWPSQVLANFFVCIICRYILRYMKGVYK